MNTVSRMNIRNIIGIASLGLLIAGSLLIGLQAAQAAPDGQTKEDRDRPAGIYRGLSPVVKFDVSLPLRDIAPVEVGVAKGFEFPELPSGLEGPLGPQDVDPIVQVAVDSPQAMPTPIVSFNGPPNIYAVSPPDPVGDVGPNHYVAMSNLSFQIFDKSGNSLFGPVANNTLWSGFGGDCEADNSGDPIVVYDQLSDRWFLTQFTASGPTYLNCVAVSTTGDPTGTYYRYAFSSGNNFPDYPKYGIWPDALYISTREFANGTTFAGMGAYAVNRAQLVAGNPTPQVISFLIPPGGTPYNIGDGLLPSDLDGSTLPPPNSPNYFVGSMDDGGPYSAPQDALTLWKFTVDFSTPGNSTFVLANTIPITAYDTIFPCSPGERDCIPQPDTSNKVDILSYRQRPLWRLAYRNYGTHESLVTNQAVEASSNMAGIRWWEIRSPNNSPFIYQEGTYAPGVSDGIHRWMGSIAMDASGNMALGYSASNATTTFPSVWYTGRLATDPLGTMPQGEASIIDGTGSQTGSQRWGDYTSMNIDPVDDCTFWYVNQWLPTTSSVGWQLRIGAFKFPTCSLSADFDLTVTPTSQAVCKPADASYSIDVGSLLGFSDPVTLSSSGEPVDTTTSFSANPVIPPESSTFVVGNTGVAASGSYTITVTGNASTSTHTTELALHLFDSAPGAAVLVSPANLATYVPLLPTFSWTAPSESGTFDLEVATDSQFNIIVYSASGLTTDSHTPGTPFSPGTTHYWRVRSNNACGSGEYSQPFAFVTLTPAGSCPIWATPTLRYIEDFESGAPGWTHSGTGDTWALSTANPHSGSYAFHGDNPASISDQRLVSPGISLPSGEDPLILSFWNYQHMEARTGGCYDGGILEVTTDGGSTWNQVPNASLVTDPYDGPISNSFSNPLADQEAWCGDPQPYLDSQIDISAYAGQTAHFRFRLGSDVSVFRPGWDIDDVSVQSCQPSSYSALLGTDQSKTTLPDSGVDYVFTMLNLGLADSFELTLSGNAWATNLVGPSTINVGSGSSVTVTVHVETPAVISNNLDVSDIFILTAASAGDPAQILQVSGTTRSLVTPGAQLAPVSQSKSGIPGGTVDYTFTVTSTSNFTDTHAIYLSGNSWPASAPTSLTLGPGQANTVTVQVSIPLFPAGEAVIFSDTFTLSLASGLDSNVLQASGTTSAGFQLLYLPFIRR